MKKLIFTTLAVTLSLAACGQKSSVGLKATNSGIGNGNGTNTAKKVDGAFYSPNATVTQNKKLAVNQSVPYNLVLQKQSFNSTLTCVDTLLPVKNSTGAKDSLLLMQGGAQVIVGQDTKKQSPTVDPNPKRKNDPLKPVLNVVCMSPRSDLTGVVAKSESQPTLEGYDLVAGSVQEYVMKVPSKTAESASFLHVRIGCIEGAEAIAKADTGLLQNTDDGSDILLVAGSVVMFENQTLQKIVLTCKAAPKETKNSLE